MVVQDASSSGGEVARKGCAQSASRLRPEVGVREGGGSKGGEKGDGGHKRGGKEKEGIELVGKRGGMKGEGR